jgi:hypothetical protein
MSSPIANPPKSEVLKFLSDANTRVLTYHNHKEVSAWGAVAFFYVFGAAVFGLVTRPFGSRVILSIWTVGVAIFVYRYILTQLALRRSMSEMTMVLYRLAAEVLIKNETELAELDWTTRPLDFPSTGRGTLDFAMPRFVVDEYDRVRKTEHVARGQLESYPLIIFGLAVAVLVFLIWQSNLPLL